MAVDPVLLCKIYDMMCVHVHDTTTLRFCDSAAV